MKNNFLKKKKKKKNSCLLLESEWENRFFGKGDKMTKYPLQCERF